MRLGKEEAVGYVEDTADETEAASPVTEQVTTGQPRREPLLTPQPAEPPLPVG